MSVNDVMMTSLGRRWDDAVRPAVPLRPCPHVVSLGLQLDSKNSVKAGPNTVIYHIPSVRSQAPRLQLT